MPYTPSDLTKPYYTTGQTARYFNVTPHTIQEWDRKGKLKSTRNKNNRRQFPREEIVRLLTENNLYHDDTNHLADDTSHIYAEMLDGDARDLEETLQRIDDVLVDSLIDYYVGCELGESTLPADFFIENLQMETLDGYESAVQDCLDLEPARELEDVLA